MSRGIVTRPLRALAQVGSEVDLHIEWKLVQRSRLDVLEAQHTMGRRTIRDCIKQQRCPFLRSFAYEKDVSR